VSGGEEELRVTVYVERFQNGAHVRLKLAQRRARPNELKITVEAEADSEAIESCILTATMGNKARTRLLFLKDGPVSSLQLYPDYRADQFAPHRIFPLERLPRAENGDVLVSVMNDEENPAAVEPFGRPGFWNYRVTRWCNTGGSRQMRLVRAEVRGEWAVHLLDEQATDSRRDRV
jgi:hypothetical protein